MSPKTVLIFKVLFFTFLAYVIYKTVFYLIKEFIFPTRKEETRSYLDDQVSILTKKMEGLSVEGIASLKNKETEKERTFTSQQEKLFYRLYEKVIKDSSSLIEKEKYEEVLDAYEKSVWGDTQIGDGNEFRLLVQNKGFFNWKRALTADELKKYLILLIEIRTNQKIINWLLLCSFGGESKESVLLSLKEKWKEKESFFQCDIYDLSFYFLDKKSSLLDEDKEKFKEGLDKIEEVMNRKESSSEILYEFKNDFSLLEIEQPTFDKKVVKAKFNKLAKKYHPDTLSDSSSNDKFIEVQKAYDNLRDHLVDFEGDDEIILILAQYFYF